MRGGAQLKEIKHRNAAVAAAAAAAGQPAKMRAGDQLAASYRA